MESIIADVYAELFIHYFFPVFISSFFTAAYLSETFISSNGKFIMRARTLRVRISYLTFIYVLYRMWQSLEHASQFLYFTSGVRFKDTAGSEFIFRKMQLDSTIIFIK